MTYLGFRIEIVNHMLARSLEKRFNAKFPSAKISNVVKDGKITVERLNGMLIAHGTKADYKTRLTNFALLCDVPEGKEELFRLVQIMNVLGNDRLIKEKISSFVDKKSMLVSLPQLNPIRDAIIKLDTMMPGFIRHGWYYAPEAMFDK